LLPNQEATFAVEPERRRADAVFRLDTPEPPSARRATEPGRNPA
jgi:hypothetical protein